MTGSSSLQMHLRVKMLDSVVEFLRRTGMDDFSIRESFEKCMASRDGSSAQRKAFHHARLRSGAENIAAELLRVWHRDGRYIDNEARPKPLSLTKGRKNLSSILKRLDSTTDPRVVLMEMKRVRLIRRTATGKYLPTSESAIVGMLHPLAIDHTAKLVIRLVSTVARNVDPARSRFPLIERHAYAPDLNRAESAAFATFTRDQGMAYLESVDNWLEQRRVGRLQSEADLRETGIAASVHLFAYLDDEDTIPRRNVRSGWTRRSRRPPAKTLAASGPAAATSPRATRA
jgi:hypothetical protein